MTTMFALQETLTKSDPQQSIDSTYMPTVERANDNMSDISSICHSPTWSDYGGKKKKQKKAEAKHREQERKSGKEKETTEKKPKRLTKASPISKARDRSNSALSVQTIPSSLTERVEDYASGSSTGFSHTKQSLSIDEAFIGGVKLKMASDVFRGIKHVKKALSRDKINESDRTEAPMVNSVHSTLDEHLKPHEIGTQTISIRGPPQQQIYKPSVTVASERNISPPSIDGPYSESSFATRIAKEAMLIENSWESVISNRGERGTQRYTKAWPYSVGLGPSQAEPTRKDKIRAAVEADLASARSVSSSISRRRRPLTRSPDRGSMRSIDSTENPLLQDARPQPHRIDERTITPNTAYGSHQPKEKYTSYLANEPLTPPYYRESKLDIDHSTSLANCHSRTSDQEDEVEAEYGGVDCYHDFRFDSVTHQIPDVASLVLNHGSSSHDVSEPGESMSPKSGFKSSAKASFSQRKIRPTTPDSSLEDVKEAKTSNSHLPKNRSHSVTSLTYSTMRPGFKFDTGSKAVHVLGAPVDATGHSVVPPQQKNVSGSASSSSTDRSDDQDRASVIDFSNVTTPTGSRPQSYQPPITQEQGSLTCAQAAEARPESGLTSRAGPERHRSSSIDFKDGKRTISRSPVLSGSKSTPVMVEDLDFLPQLKHQALVRPQANSVGRRTVMIDAVPTLASSSSTESMAKKKHTQQSILKPPAPEIQLAIRSESPSNYLRDARLLAPRPPLTHRFKSSTSSDQGDPIAKMFVICCQCKFFHDLPSKIYESMAAPDSIVEDHTLGVSGAVSTMVRCPWCRHPMTTKCCAGYAAVVHLLERFH